MAPSNSLRLTFFLVCAFVLAVARADKDVEVKEFKRLKNEVFGPDKGLLFEETISQKIQRMIKILKAGNIPADVQGEITVNHLNALITDCEPQRTCNLADVLTKVDRMKNMSTKSEYLKSYSGTCSYTLLQSCAEEVYERAKKKLSALNEEGWAAIRGFAVEVDEQLSPDYYFGQLVRSRREESELSYHHVVLRTLKALYPAASNKVAKKWTKREESLRQFMDRIRSPCATFLDNLDPVLDNYPSQGNAFSQMKPMQQLMLWNFYKNNCKRIVSDWEDILKKSYLVYKGYLADPKPESTSCWSGGYNEDDGGSAGYTTTDLLFMSGRR